jgi:hypothetical protein
MSVFQLSLSEPGAPRVHQRHIRRPFTPSHEVGPYRLPRDVRGQLLSALASFRNRDAAYALAVFIGRFWSTTNRITSAFPLDRRELAGRPDLDLTEARIRGAIRTLEAVGFLDRAGTSGSTHKPTTSGELHRKPILFTFGSEYAASLSMANKRAQKARERHSCSRRSRAPMMGSRVSTAALMPPTLKSPKNKGSEASKVLMGDLSPRFPALSEINPRLEAALERWKRAAEGQGLLRSDQRDS